MTKTNWSTYFIGKLDFSTYLCGYSNKEHNKDELISHVRNIENLKIDSSTKEDTIGFETYCSKYEDVKGKSEIVFTIDKVKTMEVKERNISLM